LNYLIELFEIRIKHARIKTILKWSQSKTLRQIQMFIDFTNFYRRFIRKFSWIAFELTNLSKKRKKNLFDLRTKSKRHSMNWRRYLLQFLY
jgi:ribosomal protein L29